MRNVLFISLLTIILTGCVVGARTSETDLTQLDTLGNDAVLVLRLKPHYRVHIKTGTKNSDGWASDETSFNSAVAANTYPHDEFIVVRLKGTVGQQMYGLTRLMPNGISSGFSSYEACKNMSLPTFELPSGQVTYIGSLIADINTQGNRFQDKIQIDVQENFAKIKEKLSIKYPKIAEKMKYRPLSFQRVTKALCSDALFLVPGVITNR